MVLVGVVVLAGAALRWSHLVDVPRFTDEVLEINRALSIARGERLPLTSYVEFTGPLYQYLLATAFRLFGPSVELARLSVLVLGCLTIPATYALGVAVHGRITGLIAAGLIATSTVHVVISSHIAWTHSITPLVLTVAILLLHLGLERGRTGALLSGAFVLALALQTHPSVFLVVPGIATAMLLRARQVRPGRIWLGVLALLVVGYGNLLVFNVQQPLRSVTAARQKEADYTRSLPEDSRGYSARLGEVVSTLIRLPGSQIQEETANPRVWSTVAPAYAGLSGLGLVLLWRGGALLLPLVVVSLMLCLPLVSAQHDLLPRQGRYLAPLLPTLFVGLGVSLSALSGSVRSHRRRAAVAAAALLLIVLPIGQTFNYYQREAAAGRTNERYFQAIAALRERSTDARLLDWKLSQERTGAGGDALLSLATLARLEGLSTDVFPSSARRVRRVLDRLQGETLLLSPRSPVKLSRKLPAGSSAVVLLEPGPDSAYYLYLLRPTAGSGRS